ncbi:MAG: transcription-repair coupling factor [Spirochaetales bacterium]|nr:transcription-repair coupling factor [Spirochaetales bacterium]
MITLCINEILEKLKGYQPFSHLINSFRTGKLPVSVFGIQDGLLPFIVSEIHSHAKAPSLVLVSTEKEAEDVMEDLKSLCGEEVVPFPWWGVAPYKDVSPVSSVFFERTSVLEKLLAHKPVIIVAPLRAFVVPLPDPVWFKQRLYTVRKRDEIHASEVGERLTQYGYLRVPKVSVRGEFAVRGEVIDIFSPDAEHAIRIVFAFDEVEEIRLFDPATQTSISRKEEITIYPLREVLFTEETGEVLGESLRDLGVAEDDIADLKEKIGLNTEFDGIELYYPLCFRGTYSLLDYLSPNSSIFLARNEIMLTLFDAIEKEYNEQYARAKRLVKTSPPPERILLDFPRLAEKDMRKILFSSLKKEFHMDGFLFHCDPPRSFFGNIPFLKDELQSLLDVGYTIVIFGVYESQAKRIEEMLKDLQPKKGRLLVVPASISGGFSVAERKLICISESEIFGRKRPIPRSIKNAKTQIIDSFVDLEPGDYVVHLNYGIGLYCGIERIRTHLNERDYIHLEYGDSEIVYLPIEQVNLIQRYIAQEGRKPKLDRIGGKGWEKRKERVRRSVEDLADRLLSLYAKRRQQKGYSFQKDSEWQKDFEAGFPFQETDDQLRCIEEVKTDMEATLPMDRLVCGDVGYGKTEIALRAAFKAVMGGKQVAVLAPTTILTEQHYETFTERFRDFPVSIEMLSRFRPRREQKSILGRLACGGVDIIIGTHRLVQKDVVFKNLGLIVVDEEQRFGVKHKEILKELKVSVDCLTLTATPIPRTLHMALMKIRDMSILNTPPQNRLPIETSIQEFDSHIIGQAIRREVEREGQVYFLHNRIETLPQTFLFLKELVPDVSIDIAHGRMTALELEDVMHRFIHREFRILLTTTIIENGIDIPNVNTIIINRADMFGISQLYQLRGRVGRSDVPAYAYLLYPKSRVLSEIAMKRLRIISDYTELGSGFKIALKDLEIRGAGNLLGREQHGDILAVGFDMYIKLLDDVIAEKKHEGKEEEEEVYLELEYSGYIPDSYISEPVEKMEVYKKVASITNESELEIIYGEITDRFGPLPDEVTSIFSIAEIRVICKKLSISSLRERDGVITVEFSRLAKVSADRVLRLIRESGGSVFLDSRRPQCICFKIKNIGLREKAEFLRDRLSRLV